MPTRVLASAGALALAGAAMIGAPAIGLAPDAPLPGATGILPGPNPSGGNWGDCEPAYGLTDCSANTWGAPNIYSAFQGVDNAANVVVGGDFRTGAGSSETEGLLAVVGDVLFTKGYSVGVVGAGSYVTPEDGAPMLLAAGDVTVEASQSVSMGLLVNGEHRYGLLAMAGAQNFQVPSWSGGAFGNLGNTDPSAPHLRGDYFNELLSLAGLSGYTVTTATSSRDMSPFAGLAAFSSLFGEQGSIAQYSQGCYAPLSDAGVTQARNAAGVVEVYQGAVAQTGGELVLTGDGSAALQVFELPSAAYVATTVRFANIADDATVLINLTGDQVSTTFTNFEGDGPGQDWLSFTTRVLWNIPTATDISIGGASQYPGSFLIGSSASQANLGASGFNGRIYTAGDLVHQGTNGGSGSEFHAYPFEGSLACVLADDGGDGGDGGDEGGTDGGDEGGTDGGDEGGTDGGDEGGTDGGDEGGTDGGDEGGTDGGDEGGTDGGDEGGTDGGDEGGTDGGDEGGTDGTDGTDGTEGTDGTDSTDSTDGTDASDALAATGAEHVTAMTALAGVLVLAGVGALAIRRRA
ncbi:choice-of-anchor A family protein [Demequina sp.]|uniref:choice-of-anchor A family protein n=1 Tax=Demequina sp. TaxID=2050685 RepID=UPI003A8C5981